jgi:hypothetical protein
MKTPTAAISVKKSHEPETAEDVCKLLEQTVLKYFPSNRNDRPKTTSVPSVPNQQKKLFA